MKLGQKLPNGSILVAERIDSHGNKYVLGLNSKKCEYAVHTVVNDGDLISGTYHYDFGTIVNFFLNK